MDGYLIGLLMGFLFGFMAGVGTLGIRHDLFGCWQGDCKSCRDQAEKLALKTGTESVVVLRPGITEPCRDCGGSGIINVQSTRGPLETDAIPCPSCAGRPVGAGKAVSGRET